MKNNRTMKIKGMHTQPYPIIMTLGLYSYRCVFIKALLHFIAKFSLFRICLFLSLTLSLSLSPQPPRMRLTRNIHFNWYVTNCSLYWMGFHENGELYQTFTMCHIQCQWQYWNWYRYQFSESIPIFITLFKFWNFYAQ